MGNSLYWLWLSQRLGQGTSSGVRVLERFGSPRAVYETSDEELLAISRRLRGGK